MMVDNEVLKLEVFDNEFMIGFYGGCEGFTKTVQSREGYYVEQSWGKHSIRELKSVGRTFLKEDWRE